ncbi:MAG: dTMP kinase [Anaerolineae bacterium]
MEAEAGKGFLMAIEGIDQSGKKTLSDALLARLEAHGVDAVAVSFPDYNTSIGREIRAYLAGTEDSLPEVRSLLFAANRWERSGEIGSWLSEGKVVVANRYRGSGVAYGMAHGLEREWLWGLERGLPVEDRTILIEIPADISFARKRRGRDAYERQPELLGRVGAAYRELAAEGGWLVLDGDQAIDTLAERIWDETGNLLLARVDAEAGNG